MINVLHLVNKLNSGGAERQLYHIVKCSDKKIFSHQIFTLMGKGQLDQFFVDLGLNIVHLGLSRFSFSLPILAGLLRIRKELTLNNMTLLHSWLYHPNFYAALVKSISPKSKLIVSKRGQNFWYKRRHFLFNRFTYGIADGILVNSNHLEEAILRYMPGVERKIHIIPNVLDIPKDTGTVPKVLKKLRQEGRFVVGIVGRFVPEKEPLLVLEALKKVKKDIPEICFVFVGDGNLFENCQAYVSQKRLETWSYFAGYHENTFSWYKGFDVYLLGSSSEGLPNTLLEALGMGVPVISTAVGAVPDIIENNNNGLLISPCNCEELVAAIKKMYASPELRDRLRLKGLETIASFSIENINAYENMYLSVAGRA